jgi:hypothetical protein
MISLPCAVGESMPLLWQGPSREPS